MFLRCWPLLVVGKKSALILVGVKKAFYEGTWSLTFVKLCVGFSLCMPEVRGSNPRRATSLRK